MYSSRRRGTIFETLGERFGLAAAVGLDDADDDVIAVLLAGAGLLQHFVGLADARRGADEDAQLADAAFLAARRLEQRFRRGPMFGITPLFRHRQTDVLVERVPFG